MKQSYKVFLNNYFIFFVSQNQFGHLEDIDLRHFFVVRSLSYLLKLLKSKKFLIDQNVLFYSNNLSVDFLEFKSNFHFLVAAGGVVKNLNNQYLMILKNNIWDLPKGKVKFKEEVRDAAIREVYEETNLRNLKITSKSFKIFHMYFETGIPIFLKETNWFLMQLQGDATLIGQKEEGITDIKWMDYENILKIKTYASIHHLFQQFIN